MIVEPVHTRVILFLCLLNSGLVFTAEVPTNSGLRGNIYDELRGVPVGGVQVGLRDTPYADVADSSGYYELAAIPPGKYMMQISRIGYAPDTIAVTLKPEEITYQDVYLTEEAILLDEVVVEASSRRGEASGVGVERLSARDLADRPAVLGDMMRTLQTQSGITGAGDYTGYYSVRGAGEYENMVIVDGVIIHNPYRFRSSMGAGLSDINPNTVKSLDIHLSGYKAKFGNALASVLEVQSEYGEGQDFGVEGHVSPLEINTLLHGPLPANKGAVMVSIRRTYYDFLAEHFAKGPSSFPSFSELSGKMTLNLNKVNKLDLSLARSSGGTELLDNVSSDLNVTEDSKTKLFSARWRSTPGENWQRETVLSFYDDETGFGVLARELDAEGGAREQRMTARIKNLAVSEDMLYKIKEQSWLNAGLQTHFISSRVRFLSSADNLIYARRDFLSNIDFADAYQYYAAYLEYATPLNQNLHVRSGLRYDHQTLCNSGNLAPRFAVMLNLPEELGLTASWGLIYQYPEPASFQNRDPVVDVSRNITNLTAEKAIHYLLGMRKSFPNGVELQLDIYYRELDRLILPADDGTRLATNSGIGTSRGIELKTEKQATASTKMSGFLSYALAIAQYRSIEDKTWIPAKFDRRHSIKFFTNLRLSDRWRVSALGQMASGLPYSDAVGFQVRGSEDWTYVRGATNRARFPLFHKLDLRLSYGAISDDTGVTFHLDLLNVTNRKNVYDIIWEEEILPSPRTLISTKRTLYMLPFMPSFGLTFRL
jgi:hypothetical protein